MPLAAVIRCHQHEGGVERARLAQHGENGADLPVGFFHRAVILAARPTRVMPGVIHVIQVDEEQFRTVSLPVLHRGLCRPLRAALVFHHIRKVVLHQFGEAGPVVKYGDAASRPLGTQSAENVWKTAGFVLASRHDFLHSLQVAVGSDAVLLRAGRGNHRHPVGAAERGHHAARLQAPRPARHQFAQGGAAGRDYAINAEPVHADDDDVWLRRLINLPRGQSRAA